MQIKNGGTVAGAVSCELPSACHVLLTKLAKFSGEVIFPTLFQYYSNNIYLYDARMYMIIIIYYYYYYFKIF